MQEPDGADLGSAGGGGANRGGQVPGVRRGTRPLAVMVKEGVSPGSYQAADGIRAGVAPRRGQLGFGHTMGRCPAHKGTPASEVLGGPSRRQ